MTRSVAGHVTLYAIRRYALDGFVTQAEQDRAEHEMEEFLKAKGGQRGRGPIRERGYSTL